MAVLPVFQAVGAGAYGRGTRPGCGLGVQDDGVAIPQAKQQVRISVAQVQHQGLRIRRVDGGDVVEQPRFAFVAGIGLLGTQKAPAHGLGVQRCTVVKAHAGAQGEAPDTLVGAGVPGLGQQGAGLAVLLDLGQSFQQVVVDHFGIGGRRCAGRVEAVRLQGHADVNGIAPFLGLRRPGQGAGRQQNQCITATGVQREHKK